MKIILLDRAGELIDLVQGGAAYTPGILKIVNVTNSSIDFEFYSNGAQYRLEVDDQGRIRMPLPSGWRYPALFQRHRLSLCIIKA